MRLPLAGIPPLVALLLIPGCLGGAEVAPQAESASGLTLDASFEGATGSRSCTRLVLPLSCSAEFGDRNFNPAPDNATIARVEGVLTWVAETDDTRTLHVFVVADDDDDGVYFGDDSYPDAEGESPLAIAFDLADLAPRKVGFGVTLSAPSSEPGIGPDETPSQPFRFVGNWTLARAAA